MNAATKQLLLFALFAGLVGFLVVRKYFPGGDETAAQTETPPDEAMARYGFYLQEVSQASGIDFVHQAPTAMDERLAHIMPIVASMGAAVSVADFNRDGLADLYVVNSGEGSRNSLYQNLGDGQFRDVAEAAGVADLNLPGTGVCMGAVWGDYDNDGYEDLLVYKWGRSELLHNDGGQKFTRMTDRAGLPAWANLNSAIWVDFDRDGWLDLFAAGYWPEHVNLWRLETTKIMPDDFEYASNGGRKYLLRNQGNGTFSDVTEQMGIRGRRWTLAVAAADLCGGGYPDLFVANDYGVSELYANRGGKEFVEIGEPSGIARAPKSGMNASFGDVYNQGQLAVYVSNISEPGNLLQGNNLWAPEPGRTGENIRFMNHANGLGVELGGWSWGAQFGDLNNDGLLDLYLANGYISADPLQNYWYDYSKIATAYKGIIVNAQNWPPIKNRSLSGFQKKHLWIGKGGKFVDVAPAVGVRDTFDGRAVALADLWNRGVLDVVVANQKGPLLVYKNTAAEKNSWIQFELEGAKSNRSAIGAQLRLYWNGQEQVQEVSGGSGYAAQNQRRVHFGLGANAQIEKAVIRWPSGQTQTIEAPAVNMLHKVKES